MALINHKVISVIYIFEEMIISLSQKKTFSGGGELLEKSMLEKAWFPVNSKSWEATGLVGCEREIEEELRVKEEKLKKKEDGFYLLHNFSRDSAGEESVIWGNESFI